MPDKISKMVKLNSDIMKRLKEFINRKREKEGRNGNKIYIHMDSAMREYMQNEKIGKKRKINFDLKKTHVFLPETLEKFSEFIGNDDFDLHLNMAIAKYLQRHEHGGKQ